MTSTVASRPRDCLACRLVSSAGLIGIGAYIANYAYKNKSVAGKYSMSFLSFGFVVLGVARYKQTYPFNKAQEQKS